MIKLFFFFFPTLLEKLNRIREINTRLKGLKSLLILSLAEQDRSEKIFEIFGASEIIPLSKITKGKFEFDSRIRSRLWQQGS